MGNRTKLDKAFGDGPFGLPDVPTKVGHKFQAWVEAGGLFHSTRPDKRSWKRRRKTRWRPKGG
jgi:hypothetical protein